MLDFINQFIYNYNKSEFHIFCQYIIRKLIQYLVLLFLYLKYSFYKKNTFKLIT